MLNKEIKDTLKLFAGSIVVVLVTLGFAFLMIRLLVDETFPFSDFAPLLIYVAMMGIAFYLGISLFAEEKNERSFEYLFSLKYSRGKILLYKTLPRSIALLGFLAIYGLLSTIIRPFTVPSGWMITILLYFFFFLSTASMSLLHRNHVTNLVYALGIYMILYGIFAMVILQFQGLGNHVIFSIIHVVVIIIFVISLLIFITFWHHFKKADLGNLTGLFGKSIFSCLKVIGIPIMVLLIIWILINRFDAAEMKGEFKLAESPPAHYDKENGFYRLWTLSEAPRVNTESKTTLLKYRHLFDPQFDNDRYLQAWDHLAYRDNYKKYNAIRHSILKERVHALEITIKPQASLVRKIKKSRDRILTLRNEYSVFLERYQKLLGCTVFEDITLPRRFSPIPNLLAWIHISKLHDWISVLDALDGRWEPAFERLINHIVFVKRVLRGTRVLLINLVAKGVMRYSLQCLASLMNHKDCPPQIYQMVLDRLAPVSVQKVGSQTAMQADYISTVDYIEKKHYLGGENPILKIISALFFQKNRTKGYFFEPYQEIIALENQPPYQWKNDLDEIRQKYSKKKKGFFRWIQNPYGKSIAKHIAIPNLLSVVHKTYHTKILVDLIRISAELHLRFDPNQPVERILESFDTYKIEEPCSGNPYIWKSEKQILYSLRVDRDDDGGTYSYNTYYDTDYILPVILSLR